MSLGEIVTRVLIVDDHAIVRKGIRALLSREHEIEVIGEAPDGEEAIDLAQRLCPDVILMDLVMPKLDGIGAIKQIVAQQSKARILVLTSFAADDKVFPALRSGAQGYLLKDIGPNELVKAVRGGRFDDASHVGLPVERFTSSARRNLPNATDPLFTNPVPP